jgi:hypothetical protein
VNESYGEDTTLDSTQFSLNNSQANKPNVTVNSIYKARMNTTSRELLRKLAIENKILDLQIEIEKKRQALQGINADKKREVPDISVLDCSKTSINELRPTKLINKNENDLDNNIDNPFDFDYEADRTQLNIPRFNSTISNDRILLETTNMTMSNAPSEQNKSDKGQAKDTPTPKLSALQNKMIELPPMKSIIDLTTVTSIKTNIESAPNPSNQSVVQNPSSVITSSSSSYA